MKFFNSGNFITQAFTCYVHVCNDQHEMEPCGLDQIIHLCCKVLSILTMPFGITKKHVHVNIITN